MYVRTYRFTYRVRVRGRLQLQSTTGRRLELPCSIAPPGAKTALKRRFGSRATTAGRRPCRASQNVRRFGGRVAPANRTYGSSTMWWKSVRRFSARANRTYGSSTTYSGQACTFFQGRTGLFHFSISNHVLIISIFLYTTISKCWAKLHLFVHVPSRLTFNLAWHNCNHFVQLYQ